jgi:hypothetical protein
MFRIASLKGPVEADPPAGEKKDYRKEGRRKEEGDREGMNE